MSQEIYWYFLTLTESYRINKTEVAKQKKKKKKKENIEIEEKPRGNQVPSGMTAGILKMQ